MSTRKSTMKSDTMRLNALAKDHGVTFRVVGSTYIFDDFKAHGLRQALGYLEGFDRGYSEAERIYNNPYDDWD